MRDDYGIVDFSRGSKNKKLNYNILKLRKSYVINEIKKHSIAKKYINSFYKVLNK